MLGPRRRAVQHRDPAAPQQGLQLLDQRRRRPHVPLGAERKCAARALAMNCTATWQPPPRCCASMACSFSKQRTSSEVDLEHDAARFLLAQPLELADLVRAQHPGVGEFVEAQLAFDEQQRVLHEDLAVLLVLLVEETDRPCGRSRRRAPPRYAARACATPRPRRQWPPACRRRTRGRPRHSAAACRPRGNRRSGR